MRTRISGPFYFMNCCGTVAIQLMRCSCNSWRSGFMTRSVNSSNTKYQRVHRARFFMRQIISRRQSRLHLIRARSRPPVSPASANPKNLTIFEDPGARSGRGSDSPPDCHSTPRPRFATSRGRLRTRPRFANSRGRLREKASP